MKKFVSLFTGMLMIVSVFAQTNFQELTLEKALEKAKYEGLKSIKDFKTKAGVELIPFYDAHHCRYVVYWQK